MRPPSQLAAVSAQRSQVASDLRKLLASDAVIDDPVGLSVFESDALTAYRQLPLVAALPSTTAEIAAVLRYCHEAGLKVVARGAGTSLSGGALPLEDGVLLCLSKLNRILDVDFVDRCVTAQAGVTNIAITRAVQAHGYFYAPDPSSQIACTIGGNVAENSGGVHCLKYGLTTNNLLGVEVVLITGEIIRLGGRHLDDGAYDLIGVITGSEGLLGVATEVTVRILAQPASVAAMLVGFASVEEAGVCVAEVISAGIIPAGLEMMDHAAVHAVEAFTKAGYPLDVRALLIVELAGSSVDVETRVEQVASIATRAGATFIRTATEAAERERFWAGRKAAFPAVGRISPDYLCMDGTIPRRELPGVLSRIEKLSSEYGLRVVNVFHAGDGNLHPMILYDSNSEGELELAEAFGADILRLCVEVGGVLTGEHGVGIEKRDLMPVMFNEVDLDQQMRVKCAFDDLGLLNPGKVFPKLRRCAEEGRVHVHRGMMRFPDLPRF